ncbi:MAG: endolytic transglycosylase MltG [Pseudomonadota bacterium]
MKRLLAVLLVTLALGAVMAGLAWREAQAWLSAPLPVPAEGKVFVIDPGSTLGSVAHDLESAGVLAQPRWFVWLARWRQSAGAIQAGEYLLSPGTTPDELLEQFTGGRVVQHTFTIIEGWSFRQLREALQTAPLLEQSLAGVADDAVMRELGFEDQHPEGRFFPDTYAFPRGTTDAALLKRAHDRMQRELAAAWGERAEDLPLANPEEALILASIIEKESSLDSERDAIAGVFVRRLRRGMRLQTDPTVIYGLGDAYDGNIRRDDLQRDTPYNTYTRKGLPPTPIAMPSATSLAAAVAPREGTALYFVATGDGDGAHYFSDTLEEHNAAVQRYLKKLRSRPR